MTANISRRRLIESSIVGTAALAGATSAFAPLETRFLKDFVQTFHFRLTAYCHGSGHHLCTNRRVDFPAFEDGGCGAEIRNSAVGAASDENMLNRNPGHPAASREALIS